MGKHRLTGSYEVTAVGGEQVRAFLPRPLPPDPPLDLSGRRQRLLEEALLSLGRLDSVSTLLPDPQLFLYAYVRKEAVLSSQIEGTQSSLSDLLLFELEAAPGVPIDDVVDVSNYVAALQHGLERLASGFPFPTVCCAKSTKSSWLGAGATTSCRASSADRKTGSAAHGRVWPTLSLRRPMRWPNAWASWSVSFMMTAPRLCRCLSGRVWRICNSRPSTPFWTATVAWVGC